MRTSASVSASALLTTAIFLSATQIQAAIHYVGVDDFGFSPSTLEINTGDTVVWFNNDEVFPHTTTSDPDVSPPDNWDFTLVGFEDVFAKTFNNVGVFTYYDRSGIGTGIIKVSTLTPPPTITLETPRIEAGKFLFEATGLSVGKTNILEVSTNLVQWLPVSTNIAGASSMMFTNAATTGSKFFRLLEQP